jgi:hypothetical protein
LCRPRADRIDDQDAGDQDLVRRGDAHEDEAVADHPDDQRPDQGPDDRAAAAEQAGAAEHDRGDRVEVVGEARVGVADVRAGDQQQRRDPVDRAGDHVDHDQLPPDGDAHEARRLRVVAERVDAAAPRRLREHEPG